MLHSVRRNEKFPTNKKSDNVTFNKLQREQSFFYFFTNIFILHRGKLKTQQSPVILNFVWRNLGQRNNLITVTTSFSVHTKSQSRRFQIPPVWRTFSRSSVFKLLSVLPKSQSRRFQISPNRRKFSKSSVGLIVEIKLRFSNFFGGECTKPGKNKLLNIIITFADGMETLWGTLSPFTASSMKRNTKKLPSRPAVNTYLSSKLVLMCCMPPWWLSCTFSAQNELKCSKSFEPSRGWIRRTPLSIPRRRNLPEWLKQETRKAWALLDDCAVQELQLFLSVH